MGQANQLVENDRSITSLVRCFRCCDFSMALPLLATVLLTIGGCSRFHAPTVDAFGMQQDAIAAAPVQNPTMIPMVDQDFLWAQIHDELDNYFRIRREERVRLVRNELTSGWIETYPRTGSSILEPWRKDAATKYEKWLGTFQSIRRWARVNVVPNGDGLMIEVFVFRELEDTDQPLVSNAGDAYLRHDSSPEEQQDPGWYQPDRYGWISLGRDPALEARILKNIVARVSSP